MKRLIKFLLPSIIIVSFIYFFRDNSILTGLYLLFPIIFILQGIMSSNLKKDLLLGVFISSLAFIIPVNMWFSMGNCIIFMCSYVLIGLFSFYLKNRIIS